MDNRATVFIADSAEEFCAGLSATLSRTEGFQVLGTAGDGEAAIRQIQHIRGKLFAAVHVKGHTETYVRKDQHQGDDKNKTAQHPKHKINSLLRLYTIRQEKTFLLPFFQKSFTISPKGE